MILGVPKHKVEKSKEIEAQVKAFLAAGGKVTQCTPQDNAMAKDPITLTNKQRVEKAKAKFDGQIVRARNEKRNR